MSKNPYPNQFHSPSLNFCVELEIMSNKSSNAGKPIVIFLFKDQQQSNELNRLRNKLHPLENKCH